MRLKSLKLAGFKSFANPTTFTFKHDITAIVGPNGCGKSNVIDAIRWVLGETSAKQLRGGAMSDVIFAGVEGRAAKSLASVELTFEHTQDESSGIRHALNLYQELTLRRQVTKEGKSDYFINGQRVRRRDVVDVFLGTGLGARSYAVIEQGMIGRIVESSPMELRAFIEEGAGVSRYQARRDETQKKLDEARDNLDRLSDLQGELKKQQRTLLRQAESAKKYQALNDELEKINKEDLLKRIFEAWQYHEQKQQEQKTSNDGLSALENTVNKAKIELDRLSAKVAEGQWLKDDARDKYHNAQMAEQTAQHNFYTVNQELSQIDEKIARLNAIKTEAVANIKHATDELAEFDRQLVEMTPNLATLGEQLTAKKAELATMQGNWQGVREELNALQTQKNALENAQKLAESQKVRVLNNREKWIKKHNDLVLSGQSLGEANAEDEQELKRLSDEIATLTLRQESLDEQGDKDKLDELGKLVQTAQKEHSVLEKRHTVLSSEYDILHKMLHAKPATTEQSDSQQASFSHLPRLKDVVKLSRQGERFAGVLDGFLGFWLNAQISENLEIKAALSTPNANDKQATYSILKTGGGYGVNNGKLLAFGGLFDAPRLAFFDHCYLFDGELNDDNVQSLQDLAIDGRLILTTTGWLVGAFGVLHTSSFGAKSSLLSQKAEHAQRLTELEDELNSVEDELDVSQKTLKAHTAQLENLKIAHDERMAQKNALLASLHRTQQAHTTLQAKIQTEAIKRENFAKNKAILDEEKAEISSELKSLEAELESVSKELAEHLPRFEMAQNAVVAMTKNIDEMNAAVKTLGDEYQGLQLKNSTLLQAKTHSQRLLELAKKNAEQADIDIQATQDLTEKLTAKVPVLETAFKEAKAHSAMLKITSEEHEAAAKALQLMQVKLQENLTEAHANFAKAQAEAAQLTADTAVGESRLSDLGDEMMRLDEGFNLPATLADFHVKPSKFKDNSKRIDEIKADIAKLGAVNLAAAAELAELEGRVSPMDSQIADITESMAKLEDAIRTIDEKTKSLFLGALSAVNEELNALFSKVFGGGQASLTLLDDENLTKADKWRAGLVLMAQPKGKKNSRLAVLSGGEKTLTALSLIFAIFKQHPAPFCVLDEVDAPLDDANVARFTSLIHELADSVQFIFISHNKLAMQIADELKGITMPTAGISSLVTVNLEEAASYVEA
ncbi:chromosome segregation protein SMC [Moraxella nasibovis]|uniref:chromosome segregation protein SMC n=1 Tax=Moraxella nasibovis TaxID=2904120 RepID=UPI00240EDFB8|nr:chromosome segregation protein SMC [Moraxella nasibovis]WFF38174.1 chromosome segregation protein SMC [Moraxella nasibovis]